MYGSKIIPWCISFSARVFLGSFDQKHYVNLCVIVVIKFVEVSCVAYYNSLIYAFMFSGIEISISILLGVIHICDCVEISFQCALDI